ncbi:MAG: hypothetical protein EKK40_16645 [Bradyrhizobiaceae bacterium]|nr:MAG: hypothetical protein EKK40_16645 [Bradyrhizobiaceae bacterium]
MGYVVVTLILGILTGLGFRVTVLIVVLGLSLFASLTFVVLRGLGLVEAVSLIFIVQVVIQVGYFAGVVGRSLFHPQDE